MKQYMILSQPCKYDMQSLENEAEKTRQWSYSLFARWCMYDMYGMYGIYGMYYMYAACYCAHPVLSCLARVFAQRQLVAQHHGGDGPDSSDNWPHSSNLSTPYGSHSRPYLIHPPQTHFWFQTFISTYGSTTKPFCNTFPTSVNGPGTSAYPVSLGGSGNRRQMQRGQRVTRQL